MNVECVIVYKAGLSSRLRTVVLFPYGRCSFLIILDFCRELGRVCWAACNLLYSAWALLCLLEQFSRRSPECVLKMTGERSLRSESAEQRDSSAEKIWGHQGNVWV